VNANKKFLKEIKNTNRQSRFDAGYRMLGAGALYDITHMCNLINQIHKNRE